MEWNDSTAEGRTGDDTASSTRQGPSVQGQDNPPVDRRSTAPGGAGQIQTEKDTRANKKKPETEKEPVDVDELLGAASDDDASAY